VKTAELTGTLLDYWVARAEGLTLEPYKNGHRVRNKDGEVLTWIGEGQPPFLGLYAPSSNWSDGGQIIERERFIIDGHRLRRFGFKARHITERKPRNGSTAYRSSYAFGPTYLIAAMRAYVASKFGDEVPDQELAS
jgi:hypothetical protein